jgi:hypothetical protein
VLVIPFVETVGMDGTLHWVLKHRSSAGTTIGLDLQKFRKFDAAVWVVAGMCLDVNVEAGTLLKSRDYLERDLYLGIFNNAGSRKLSFPILTSRAHTIWALDGQASTF